MRPFSTLHDIMSYEAHRFYDEPTKSVRPIALLFCRPELELMQKEIVPSLQYFDRRAGKNTAFHFAGFVKIRPDTVAQLIEDPTVKDDLERNTIPGSEGYRWSFFASDFDAIRKNIEALTKWRYSGGCDRLLLNSRCTRQGRYVDPFLDFKDAIVLRLDKIGELLATPKVANLFEAIFQYAEDQDETNPTWGLSDYLGLKTARSGLWEILLGFLPESVRTTFKSARHLVVQDISGPEPCKLAELSY
jgi:hypothetical protein